jgi:hypothetical protein
MLQWFNGSAGGCGPDFTWMEADIRLQAAPLLVPELGRQYTNAGCDASPARTAPRGG